MPSVARAVGSKNNCAAASITPVIMLYASVPGSTILSKGLKKYLPIVTVGSNPASLNFSARSPTNCTPCSALCRAS